MDEKGDIDFFIITEPKRLWLTRTLLTAFKKIFLLNSRKYFCVNYFVDTENLELRNKNIFTATELANLIPTYKFEVFRNIMDSNPWVRVYYPNFKTSFQKKDIYEKTPWFKRFFEWIFSGLQGDYLDWLCHMIHLKYLKRKFSEYDKTQFNQAFRSTKGESKHHPRNFQKLVLEAFEARLNEYEKKFSVLFPRT